LASASEASSKTTSGWDELQQWVQIEPIPAAVKSAKLRIVELQDQAKAGRALLKATDACLRIGCQEILVDMERVHFPSASFIVALFEATAHARRKKAEVRLINLHSTALNNLVTFSPLTYLRVENDEARVLEELGARLSKSAHEQAAGATVENAEPRRNRTSPWDSPGQRTATQQPRVEQQRPRPNSGNGELTRITPDMHHRVIQVESTVDEIYDVCDFVTGMAEEAGFDDREVGKIKIAVYEACLNIVEHAYHSRPSGWIRAKCGYNSQVFVIELEDGGEPFEQWEIKPYDVEKAVEDRRTGGFGLHIIHRSMDEVRYFAGGPHGNLLQMVKYLEPLVI